MVAGIGRSRKMPASVSRVRFLPAMLSPPARRRPSPLRRQDACIWVRDRRTHNAGQVWTLGTSSGYLGWQRAPDEPNSFQNQMVESDQTGISIKCRYRWLRAPATTPKLPTTLMLSRAFSFRQAVRTGGAASAILSEAVFIEWIPIARRTTAQESAPRASVPPIDAQTNNPMEKGAGWPLFRPVRLCRRYFVIPSSL